MITVTNLNVSVPDRYHKSIIRYGRIEYHSGDWRHDFRECRLTWKLGDWFKLGASLEIEELIDDDFQAIRASLDLPGVALHVSGSSWLLRKLQRAVGGRVLSFRVEPDVISVYPCIVPNTSERRRGPWFFYWSDPPNWSIFKAARRWMNREECEAITKDLYRHTIPLPIGDKIIRAPVNARFTRYRASQWPFPSRIWGFWTVEFADGFELDPNDTYGDGLSAITFPEGVGEEDALHEFVSALYRDLGLVRRRENGAR